MAKVESFDLDHDAVKAPYVRLAGREVGDQGDVISKFDIRLVQPNEGAIPTGALHTLEHLSAAYIRDYLEGVIDISPMGCRTGFYAVIWGEPTVEDVARAYTRVLEEAKKTTWDQVQGTERKQCGNYRDHSLVGAHAYADEVLKQGISLDPFERRLIQE